MSRITGREVYELMEAYQSIYEGYDEKKDKEGKKKVMHNCATHGEHAEWGVGAMIEEMHTLDEEGNITHYDMMFEHGVEKNVPVEELTILEGKMHEHFVNDEKNAEVLDEAPMTAFQAAGGQAKLDQLNKNRSPRSGRATASSIEALGQQNLYKAGGGDAAIAKGPTRTQNVRGGGTREVPTLTRQDIINRGTVAARKPGATPPGAKPPGGTPPGAKPPAAKSAPSAPATKPAIGKLGSTTFERRTPTSTELKAAQAARGSGASPEKALQSAKMAGAGAAAASRPTTNQTSTAFSSSTPALAKPLSNAPEIKQTAEIAKKTTQPTVAPTPTQMRQGTFREEVDAYDLVLEYLLTNGHADTVDEAHYVMMQMDSEHIQNIVESPGEWFRGVLNPNNSAAAKAQKTSPFNRPVTPLPSITSPFARPASHDDSGRLTTYGAGGGSAAEKGGKSREQVMRQGATNIENKKTQAVNQGPDFGR